MKCYQKNPEHKKSFWHPGDKDEPMKSDEDDNEVKNNKSVIFFIIYFLFFHVGRNERGGNIF